MTFFQAKMKLTDEQYAHWLEFRIQDIIQFATDTRYNFESVAIDIYDNSEISHDQLRNYLWTTAPIHEIERLYEKYIIH